MKGAVRIGVAGQDGRMGRALAQAVQARGDLAMVGGFGRPCAPQAQPERRDEVIADADVVVDFTSATSSVELAQYCAARSGLRPALVIGSTGFTEHDEHALAQTASRLAIVRAGNFSPGVNLLVGLVRRASRALVALDYDIEILETHHRRKIDAPSGTALMLGEAAAQGRGVELGAVADRVRDGLGGGRQEGAIGFASLRGGGIVGEHSVMFAAEDEVITLAHSARDRSLFARGALLAALWVAGRSPGLYDMQDVLGLSG